MAVPAPLPDTQRIVDWDELPDAVRQIPADFDPRREGVLMQHQSDWIRMQQGLDIAVCEKGRRTGITFAQALADTITAASDKAAGGSNVWYMADTREKGLEYIGYVARFARLVAAGQATLIESHIFVDQTAEGGSRDIQSYRVRFASGYRITALSSRPENIHGLQGVVGIDEAALHKNVRAVLESATALLIWGGKIRVWSTHRGKNNPFNELLTDVRAGRYGAKAGAIRITFDTAVENGLYERVCAMQGKAPTAEGKRTWYTAIRAAYGPRAAAMREELDAIPRDGAGTAIPSVWIERAMPAVLPVVRLVCDDDFPRQSERARELWCQTWIGTHLAPVVRDAIAAAPLGCRWAIGMDFARHRHMSVIIPARITQELGRAAPFVLELANAPTRQQQQILWWLLDTLTGWTFAGDATGPGQTLMEYTGDRYGRAQEHPEHPGTYIGGPVHEIVLSRAWYGAHMGPFISLFEDGFISLPRDASLEDDLRAIEYVDGIAMIPKLERADLKDPDLIRHGDGAIAGCLMAFAARHPAGGPVDFQSAGPRDQVAAEGYQLPAARTAGQVTETAPVGWGSVGTGLDFQGWA